MSCILLPRPRVIDWHELLIGYPLLIAVERLDNSICYTIRLLASPMLPLIERIGF